METENNRQPESISSRLGPSHIGLRPELEAHRHLLHGLPSYVIRDPITLNCHRVNKHEYGIMVELTAERSLSEIFDSLVHTGKLKATDEEGFYKFVMDLHRLGFLNLPISDDKALYRRYQAKQKAKRKEKLMSFFFLRIPLFNPNAFLDKTVRFAEPFFSRWFFMAWLLLMGISGFVVTLRYDELIAPLADIFTAHNMIYMWAILVLLKVFHEFGHAYACKVRGGHVSEMGIYLIVMTPCAYVDVTSSWGFSRKRDRLTVGLAGVYAESIIAAIALFVWVANGSSAAGLIAHKVFFLAGIMTVLMNINPLMRFDGYYVLSDLLEIPNLRQRSRQFVLQITKRVFLGIKTKNSSVNYSRPMQVILITFGIASSLYRTTVILAISAMIATKIYLVGLIMGAVYVVISVSGVLRGIIYYLWRAPESAPVRARAITVSLILLIGIPLTVFCLPVPTYVRASGQLAREHENVFRAQYDSFIDEVDFVAGQTVEPDEPLVKLENPKIAQDVLESQSALHKAQIQLKDYQQKNSPSLVAKQKTVITVLESMLQLQRKQLAKMAVHAGTTGTVVSELGENDVGRFIRQGDELGKIVGGRWVGKILLTEEDIARVQPRIGQEAQVRLLGHPGSILLGSINRISPAGVRNTNMPALTNIGQGNIMTNPITHETIDPYYELTIILDEPSIDGLRYGMTGCLKLKAESKPIGSMMIQKLLRFINNLKR